MIEIDVLNCKSYKKKKLFNFATKYFIQSLMPKIKNLNIDLCFESDLDADAFCTQFGSKYFVIEISNNLPLEDQFKSIAHELVHCRQFLRKKLEYKNNKIYWNNEIYKIKSLKRNNLSKNEYIEYYTSPWEQEAYELEEILYRNFLMQSDEFCKKLT